MKNKTNVGEGHRKLEGKKTAKKQKKMSNKLSSRKNILYSRKENTLKDKFQGINKKKLLEI